MPFIGQSHTQQRRLAVRSNLAVDRLDFRLRDGSKPRLFVFRGDGASFFNRYDTRLLLSGAIEFALWDGLPFRGDAAGLL